MRRIDSEIARYPCLERVIYYFSAGSSEDWREDADQRIGADQEQALRG